MASATSLNPSTKETSNYAQLCRLLVDVGSCVLREIFDRICPPGNLHTVLAHPQNQGKLQTLLKKRVLSASQWCKLYPAFKSSVSSRDFDSSLVLLLLRNIFGVTLPTRDWKNIPPVTENSPETDLTCLKFYREIVYSHAIGASVDDPTFSLYWRNIKDTFLRIGGDCYKEVISNLTICYMDAILEEHYRDLLREWLKDEDFIEDKLCEDEMVKKAGKEEDIESAIDILEQKSGMEDTEIMCTGNESALKINVSSLELSIKIPKMCDLPDNYFPWSNVELPVDILLLTVEDCEFLSCCAYLKEPFKSYHISTGYVYFGCMGDDQGKKMKIALMRCSKGSDVPGGSLSAAKDAISLLRPKATFSVGACSGLNSSKVKLGDVVVSSKLITAAHKTPPSRDIGNLIKHVADGWKAPSQNADESNAKVHGGGVVLSISEANRDIIGRYPEAIAVEMEGGGVFAAAHDFKTEWLVVKGIKDFANERQSSNEEWEQIACVMAASVVAKILSHPVIFKDWPHFNAGANELPAQAIGAYTAALKTSITGQTEFQPKLLASRTISNLKTDQIFTNLLIQHGRKTLIGNDKRYSRSKTLNSYGKLSGTPVKYCDEIFLGTSDDQENPSSILVVGKAGIGKSLFCQKLIRDWAKNELFQARETVKIPNFKFAYLLTFRQLNLLESNFVTLREFLTRSSVLDHYCNIDEHIFEYIVNHSGEVLIILDGYDEYSQQDYITGNSEEQYPNDVCCQMPVTALCSKLVKGKILKGAVVMITSRPDESDKLGGIRLGRDVSITGFSSAQVEEYIEKYFEKDETMKNAVLEHVMKNENLVSFAHIPMLCYLLCFEMEYTLTESENPHDLPVSTTDIYTKLIDIFELKHCAESEYRQKEIPEQFKHPPVIKSTLEKLSELAAKLLHENKPTFDESEIEGEFELEEVKKLKGSGLLYCGQPFRTALITTTKHFSFTHLTVQEFLAARWFVKENLIPDEEYSAMVFQFMSGILSSEGNEELMEELLTSMVVLEGFGEFLRVKCLSEYQDKEFAKDFVRNYPKAFCDSHGDMEFYEILSDVDSIALSFLLDIISELNKEEAAEAQHKCSDKFVAVTKLKLYNSQLTLSGIQRVCNSLINEHCPVTELEFRYTMFTDECVNVINRLVASKLTALILGRGEITDTGVARLCEALQHPSCKLTTLGLGVNSITDTGVASLCEALQQPRCKLTTLSVSGHKITDTGVANLCEALHQQSCKLTTLILFGNIITDAGFTSLCEALQHLSCKLTNLDMQGANITDTVVASLCKALEYPGSKLTSLSVAGNITDTGVASLCKALEYPSSKLTTLNLGRFFMITDTGISSLCKALQHPSCKLTTLVLPSDVCTENIEAIAQERQPPLHLSFW